MICGRRYKGVKLHRQRGQWEAQIKSAGKLVYLGMYEEEGEAAEAYDQALIAVQVHKRCDNHVPGQTCSRVESTSRSQCVAA